MRRIRRLLLPILAVVLTPFLSECSKDDAGGVPGVKPLVIGTDATYPPFETQNEKGELSGVSIDMGRALAAHLGRPVEFRNINFDGLITALKSKSIDIVISSMTANDERRKSIDFSDPYVKTGLAALVSAKSSVQTEDDLKKPGCRLVVRLGTTGEAYTRARLPNGAITALDSDIACVLEVVKGGVDAWIYDQLSLMRFHNQYPKETRALLKPLQEEFWAVGLRKGDDALRTQTNDFLKDFRAKGGFKDLAEKYLHKERAMMEAEKIPFVFDL
jgi:polar amino acid transport system substrate-binding protein